MLAEIRALAERDIPVPPADRAPFRFTLKCDIGQTPDPAFAAADPIVLDIGHRPLPDLLDRFRLWRETLGEAVPIRPALPLLTWDAQSDALDEAIRALVAEGYREWECADLSGHHRLRRLGITPRSTDWSLYALNRVAAAELARLGVETVVLSPEMDSEALEPFLPPSPAPQPEWLLFQHTPLFISKNAPVLPDGPAARTQTFTDRNGETFTTRLRNGCWQTVRNRPFCTLNERDRDRFPHQRIDFSWSPPDTDLPAIWRQLRQGIPPDGACRANFARTLL